MKQSRWQRLRLLAMILLFIVALNALAAGYSFIVEPSGKDIGISTGYLDQHAPFKDFFIPGIVLFTTIGVYGMLTATALLLRWKAAPQMLLLQGGIIAGWIIVQLLLVTQAHLLHLIIGVSGLMLAWSGWKLRAMSF